jgi:enediyne biosynthesis thioesterase
MTFFEYQHLVGFQETNVVGNVYFAHYIAWQGRCRECFLLEHCPDVIQAVNERHLSLVTTSVSCEFLAEARALDRIAIRMSLDHIRLNHIHCSFTYHRVDAGCESLLARGIHRIACMRRTSDTAALLAEAIPTSLLHALRRYRQHSGLVLEREDL